MAPWFDRMAAAVAHGAGRPMAFAAAASLVGAWLIGGFFVGFASEIYQLVINTLTTIVTFLMVFLIQNTQNRDTAALHAKIDDLIQATERAHNAFIGAERLSEDELRALRARLQSDKP
jgi:low affinity Fe/Cu permease